MAVPTFTSYTLGTVLVASGTLKIILRSTIAGMTLPVDIAKTLIFDDYIQEGYGIDVGYSEPPNITFGFVEDYTVYTEGFWFKVLNGTAAEIQLQIDESGSGTYIHLFWGRVSGAPSAAYTNTVKSAYGHDIPHTGSTPASISPVGFEELSLVTGAIIRQGSFECTDAFVARLKECTFAQLNTAVNNITYYVEISPNRYLEYRLILSAMFNLAFGEAIDATKITDEMQALRYKASAAYKTFTQLSVICSHYVSGAAAWFDNGKFAASAWSGLTCYDILKQILLTHCLYARVDYSVSGNTHEMTLVGKASTLWTGSSITEDVPIQGASRIFTRSQVGVKNIDVLYDDSAVQLHYYGINGTYADAQVEVPDKVDFELQVQVFDECFAAIVIYPPVMFYVSGGVATIIDKVGYYAVGAYSSDQTSMGAAVLRYYDTRFGSVPTSLREYEREYNTMKMTLSGVASHANAKIGDECRVSISDGVVSKTFLPSVIGKNPTSDRLKVTWIEAVV